MADLIIDDDNGLILDVLAWSGAGEQTSYLVIDFAATGGDAYAFGYHWNDTSTVLDMLIAVSSSTELVALTSDWGEWGTFLDNFTFGDESGDPTNYWSHSLATPDGSGAIDWLAASGSIDIEMLTNGGVSGWYNGFTDDYQTIPPSLPLTTIPAPGVLALGTVLLATTRTTRIRH
ncbi:MAG: hypothetical protein VX527_09405 [Planctomycetota bacterium]|nr:hypothetical protein [Planctomycetota bacterium]